MKYKSISEASLQSIMLTVGYIGMGGHAHIAKELRPLIEGELGMKLVVMSEWEDADLRWEPDTWLKHAKSFDILIALVDYKKYPYKGNNKLTQFMSLGKPVVASPLDSYLSIIKHGVNGYIARTDADWRIYLETLRDHPELRKQMGENAAKTVIDAYSIEAVTGKMLEATHHIKNCVDIIIPNYNNPRYFDLTIRSLVENTHGRWMLHIVDSSTPENSIEGTLRYLDENKIDYTYKHFDERTSFSSQVNWAIEHSNNNYVLIANNDLLFTVGWLGALIGFIQEHPDTMVGPLSNCDKGWLHNYTITTKAGVSLEPGLHSIDTFDTKDFYESANEHLFTKQEGIEREKLAFYCVLFERKLVHRIGLLDDNFLNGGEDFDYCYRARKAGWRLYSVHNSFVFHFGGKTRKVNEDENYERHHVEDRHNNERLNRKLSKSVVAFYLGAGWEKWDETNLVSGGIGGSETAAIWLAREISRLGYQVKIFADPPTQHMDSLGYDVEYVSWQNWKHYTNTTFIDFLIASRTCEPFHSLHHVYKKYVWVHDIWLSQDKNYNTFYGEVNGFLALSYWHREFLNQHHGIPLNKIKVTANGVDPTRYTNKKIRKRPGQIFYSSSPDRGLDTLLYCADFIRKYVPELRVVVAYGFNNWEKAVRVRGNGDEIRWMEDIKKNLYKPGISYIGRVDQNTLAQFQLESQAWMYPTRFWETFCITAAEAGYSKCAILASNLAGLQSTVKNSGLLLNGDAYTKEYRELFVEQAVKLLTEKPYLDEWSMKAHEHMQRFTWAAVAQQWHRMFQTDEFIELQ